MTTVRLNQIILTCLYLLCKLDGTAQQDVGVTRMTVIEQRIEAITENLEEGDEVDFTNLFDDLAYYYEHPLNLNHAEVDELRQLCMLDDFQIRSLLIHIRKFGALHSIYELQAVDGFDIPTIRMIEPFVMVGEADMWKDFNINRLFVEGRNDVFIRYKRVVEKQQGYLPDADTGEPPEFSGSPDYGYMRYRFQYRRNIQAGFTMEKDAGESMQNGPDFSSAHLFYRDKKWIKTIAIGDFQAQFGQGLTFWNGLGFGKSSFVLNTKRNAQGFRPYSSSNENQYLRGAAATFVLSSLELSLFYSSKKIDANLTTISDTVLTDDELVVSSFLEGGLHRTQSEIEDRKSLGEEIAGGHLRFRGVKGSVGITAAHTKYSTEVIPSDDLQNLYRFSGDRNTNVGTDYQLLIRNLNFFGEAAISTGGGWSMINGMIASFHPSFSFSVLQRRLGTDYHVQYYNVFSDNGKANNENGLFIGCQAVFKRIWTLSAYSDFVRSPWLTGSAQSPSEATDYVVQLNYKPDKRHDFYFRFRARNRVEDGIYGEPQIDYPQPYSTNAFRIHAAYAVNGNLSFRTRAEWQVRKPENVNSENGFLIYHDLIWKKIGFPVAFNIRYAMYDCDTWDVRNYAYESTMLYDYSIPPYYGKGSRAYFMVSVDIKRGLELWLRYSAWLYSDRDVISSGVNQIDGNRKSDFHAQLRWQFQAANR